MTLALPSVSMGENVIGLDIGRGVIAATQVEVRANRRLDLLNGAWGGGGPDLGDDALADEIRRLWQRHHLASFTVCASLRSPALVVRRFTYPALSDDELEQALWLEAEETLQIARSRIAMHWHLDPAGPDESGREGVLAAVPQDEVDRLLRILEKAGLFPIILDAGCMAVANLYLALRGAPAANEAVCVLNLLGRHADLAILYNGCSLYPRSLLSRACAWDAGVDYLASSVRDVLKYYQFKLRNEPIKEVLLAGQVPEGEAFMEHLQTAVGTPIRVWDPMKDVSVRSWRLTQALRRDARVGGILAASMGLGLRR